MIKLSTDNKFEVDAKIKDSEFTSPKTIDYSLTEIFTLSIMLTEQDYIRTTSQQSTLPIFKQWVDHKVDRETDPNYPKFQKKLLKRLWIQDAKECSAATIATRIQIFTQYTSIFFQYAYDPQGRLFYNKTRMPFNLEILTVVLQTALKAHLRQSHGIFNQGITIEVAQQLFLAKVEQGQIQIITHLCPLKQESDSVIYKVIALRSCHFEILKTALSKDTQGKPLTEESRQPRIKAIQNEIAMLNLLNAQGSKDFIQEAPSMTLNLPGSSHFPEGLVGYSGPCYSQDLFDWILSEPSKQERINCCHQLLNGYLELYLEGIRHLDLKIDNVFVDTSGTENKYRLSDWATGRRMQEKGSIADFQGTTISTSMIDYLDFEDIKQRNSYKEYVPLTLRMELYSLATIFFATLTGKAAYHEGPEILPIGTFPDTKEDFNEKFIKSLGYSDALVALLSKMLNHDPKKRPSFEEVLLTWNHLERTNGFLTTRKQTKLRH